MSRIEGTCRRVCIHVCWRGNMYDVCKLACSGGKHGHTYTQGCVYAVGQGGLQGSLFTW